MDFVSRLQNARDILASAGKGLRNHLLFRANRVLGLRVCANSSLDLENIRTDALVSLMSTTWNSMAAENYNSKYYVHISATSARPALAAIPAPSRSYLLPDLSYADREELRVAGGCYHCHLTDSPHNSRNCLAIFLPEPLLPCKILVQSPLPLIVLQLTLRNLNFVLLPSESLFQKLSFDQIISRLTCICSWTQCPILCSW
jgi:hypothetical protein